MSTAVADIVSFFNGMSASNDVGGALSNSALAFKISMLAIMLIGGLAMAIWIGRIAIDILVITLRGTSVATKMSKLGTGKSDAEGSVGGYLKSNLLEIIFVILLIFFLISGFLFRLIAVAISGFGALGNKLFGLDIQGMLGSIDIEAYKEGVDAQRPTTRKQNYDNEIGVMRAELRNLYEMNEKGQNSTKDKYVEKYNRSKRTYTHAFARAETIVNGGGTEGGGKLNEADFRLPDGYFAQHLDGAGNSPLCVDVFLDDAVKSAYGADKNCKK